MSWLNCPGVAKNANARYLRSFPLLKLEKRILITINLTALTVQRIDNDDAIAGVDTLSCVWAVYGSSNAIGLSYGPIRVVR